MCIYLALTFTSDRELFQYDYFSDAHMYTYTMGRISYFWTEQSHLSSLCDASAFSQFQGLSHIEDPVHMLYIVE